MGVSTALFGSNVGSDAYLELKNSLSTKNIELLNILENQWQEVQKYFPPEFINHFQNDPGKTLSFLWELRVAYDLLKAAYDLQPRQNNDGPDLLVNSNGQKIWIECVLPTKGSPLKPDSIQEPVMGVAYTIDHNKSVLRVTNSLDEKRRQHKRWIESRYISAQDKVILAICGANLESVCVYEKQPSEICRSLYPYGDMRMWLDKTTGKLSGVDYEYQDEISKTETGRPVNKAPFISSEFPMMNGVLYNPSLYHPPFTSHAGNAWAYVPNITSSDPYPIDFSSFAHVHNIEETENSYKISLLKIEDVAA